MQSTITSPGTYSISGTLNNGQIVVDSQVGRGTVMKVLLPLFDSHAEPEPAARSAA